MTNHPMLATLLFVLLIGAVVGWCAGWAARGEQNRCWHAGVVRQLAQTRAQLDQALDDLDHAQTWESERVSPPPVPAVHVHVDAALPSWLAQHPTLPHTPHIPTAMPVLPAEEAP